MAASTRRLDPAAARPAPSVQQTALDLARVIPRLSIEARRVATAAAMGVHGRRRAGVGENFWQFRHFTFGESAARVDWRRSARDDHLYVREREWEAVHTVWLWIDRSASMLFQSTLSPVSKVERGLVLGLALADLLVRGGERVGLIGAARPTATRAIIEKLAATLLADREKPADLPHGDPLAPLTEAVLIGDFLSPADRVIARLNALAARGARGHLLMIADPIEETFPFTGRAELVEPEDGATLTAGRVQALRDAYVARLAAHREALREATRRLGWTLTLHRTDRPASEGLLGIHPLLQASGGRR